MRDPIPSYFFVLVVVKLGRRYLLVHERKHGQRWYLPAGRVEPGETLAAAARRETLEETGVPITLEGILRVEHTPIEDGTVRCRVIYLARPQTDVLPKSEPDEESLGAAWFTIEDLDRVTLRGPEVRTILAHVDSGGPVFPLSLVTRERTGFK